MTSKARTKDKTASIWLSFFGNACFGAGHPQCYKEAQTGPQGGTVQRGLCGRAVRSLTDWHIRFQEWIAEMPRKGKLDSFINYTVVH